MSDFSRREFISHAGLGALGLSLLSSNALAKAGRKAGDLVGASPSWPAAPESIERDAAAAEKLPTMKAKTEQQSAPGFRPIPEDQKIGFAIVGLGELALNQILPAIGKSTMCRVTALVSGDSAKAKRVAAEYGVPTDSIYNYQDFDRIKDNPHVQVVYIVLPNFMHKEFTIRTAKAKKNVLCEKPMALNTGEAQEMIEACEQAKVKLIIPYRQQYEPNNRWMRELFRQKTFGEVRLFEASNFQNQAGKDVGQQQWRHVKKFAGGGALPDIGLYCLNAARFLTGEEPTRVMATQYSTPKDPRFGDVEETIAWMMNFPSGLVALCAASYGCHETKRYRFTAENGWFGMDPSFAYTGLKNEVAYALGSSFEHHDTPKIEERDQFALEMDHMADCVLHGKTPHTGGAEGLQDHKIMEAIYQSVRLNRPIDLVRVEKLDSTRTQSI